MADSPAFRFYPSDWLVGTLTMTLAEEGAYLRCINHQWSAGSLPASDVSELARIMRVPEREASKHWARICGKFVLGDDGQWRNARIETERAKQADYKQAKIDAGRRGGQAKAKQTPSTATDLLEQKPSSAATPLPVAKPSVPFPSSFSSSLSTSLAKNAGAVERGGGVMSPIEFEKLQRFNAYVGARLRIPRKLHSDFIAALGGQDTDARLRAWYADLDAEIEASGEAILPDVWKWTEARFKDWATTTAEDAEFQAMLAKAAAEDAAEAAAKGVRRG